MTYGVYPEVHQYADCWLAQAPIQPLSQGQRYSLDGEQDALCTNRQAKSANPHV